MSNQETQSKPLTERLLPQTSIRFFGFMIAVSAVVMYTFRAAIVADQFWAKCAAPVIATILGCFVGYFVLFVVANCFSVIVEVVLRPFRFSARSSDRHTEET